MMEVKILSELDHPNIVKLEGFYKERQVYCTTEYHIVTSHCYSLRRELALSRTLRACRLQLS
jgi:serine/threonine protein kinase